MAKKRGNTTSIYLMMVGGLGNQLFEYAFARCLNLEIPGSSLTIDVGSYEKYKLRKYELNHFNIPSGIRVISHCLPPLKKIKFWFFKTLHRIEFKFLRKGPTNAKRFPDFLMKRNLRFGVITCFDCFYHRIDTEILRRKKDIFILGYFQSPQYFQPHKKEIFTELQPVVDNEAVLSFCEENMVSGATNCYSFRCSELKKLGLFLEDFNPRYFDKATRTLHSLNSNRTVLLTEDPESAKTYLSHYGDYLPAYAFLPHEQLYIMIRCSTFVISNSSFSWWGSYLSLGKSKTVITPRFWYKGVETKSIGLFFDEMHII